MTIDLDAVEARADAAKHVTGSLWSASSLPMPGSIPAGRHDDIKALVAEVRRLRALDVVAEPDHRRAEHMNRTLRRVEGGDEL